MGLRRIRKITGRQLMAGILCPAFILAGMTGIKAAAAEADGSVSAAIVHRHEGSVESGGSCYRELYHEHSEENGCYSTIHCTVTVHANGGFWSQGDAYCDCHGQVHEIYQNVIKKHSSCGAPNQYTQIHFTEHHGPGTDGFRGYDSTTHTEKRLNCSRGGEVVGYELNCNETDGSEVAVLTVRPGTTQWAREVKLQAGAEVKGSIEIAPDSYIWNGGAASAQNEFLAESNGTYTCRLNAGSDNNSAEAEVSITVNNIDRKGPEITDFSYSRDWTGGEVQVTVNARDVQEDGTPGSGIAGDGYSFDGGTVWKGNTHTFTENGAYTVKVRDMLGNEGEKSLVVTNIDTAQPRLAVHLDTGANVLVNRVTVQAEDLQPDGTAGSGLAEEPFSFDGGKTWGKNNTIDIKENGPLTVSVKDKMGNTAVQTVTISNIDTAPPEFTLSLKPEDWSRECYITVNAQDKNNAGLPGAGIKHYSFDSGKTWTEENRFLMTENGTYQVAVKDRLGNQSSGKINVDSIDRTGPAVSFTQKPQLWLYGKAKVIVGAEDLQPDGNPGCGMAQQAFSADGKEWTDSGEYEFDTPGTYSFFVRDKLGNITESSYTVRRVRIPEDGGGSGGDGGDDGGSNGGDNSGGDNNGGENGGNSGGDGNRGENPDTGGGTQQENAAAPDTGNGESDNAPVKSDISGKIEAGKEKIKKGKADNSNEERDEIQQPGGKEKPEKEEYTVAEKNEDADEKEFVKLDKKENPEECICKTKCGKKNPSCPLCSRFPEKCQADTPAYLVMLKAVVCVLGLLMLILLVVLFFVRPALLYGREDDGAYRFLCIKRILRKDGAFAVMLGDIHKRYAGTEDFMLRCGFAGSLYEGKTLAIITEGGVQKRIVLSAKIEFHL